MDGCIWHDRPFERIQVWDFSLFLILFFGEAERVVKQFYAVFMNLSGSFRIDGALTFPIDHLRDIYFFLFFFLLSARKSWDETAARPVQIVCRIMSARSRQRDQTKRDISSAVEYFKWLFIKRWKLDRENEEIIANRTEDGGDEQ